MEINFPLFAYEMTINPLWFVADAPADSES